MFYSLIRHFSRISSIKTKTKDFKNIININDDVKFNRRNNNLDSSNPYDKETLEIENVFNSKFINKNRKSSKNNYIEPSNRFQLNKSEMNKNLNSSNSNYYSYNYDMKNSFREIDDYNFKEEPDEFYQFDKFESMKKNPRYQDLTHEERQYLQELEIKSRLKDPYNKLNVNKAKVDPVRDAKILLRDIPKEDDEEDNPLAIIESIGENEDKILLDKRLVEQNKFDEVVSRIRTKIRIEKKENSSINKMKIPNLNGVVMDPIKKHVLRRAARIGTMLHTHIEQLFTCNNPEFLYKHLNGASISINHVEMPTSKSTVKCYYNILSKHDTKEVQKNLDLISPKIRFMIARKLELGYTPPIKFIKYNKSDFINLQRKLNILESTFNIKLQENKKIEENKLIKDNNIKEYENKIYIKNEQITPQMNKEIQDSFHRRYCGYP